MPAWHLGRALVTAQGLTRGQQAVDTQSHTVADIPKLRGQLTRQGCMVTMDVPKQIARTVRKQNAASARAVQMPPLLAPG